MSTVATHSRPAVSARFLLTAIAATLVLAALVVVLLAVTGGPSSSRTNTRTNPGTSTYGNSCQGIRHGFC